MIQPLPEQDLIQGLKRKSTEAFEELVAGYARRLYYVSIQILRNPQDAVQETFLKAFQTIEDFREESSLYTWLYRIACNQSLMKLRHQSQHKVVPIEPYLPRFEQGQHVDPILDWSSAPDSTLETQELTDFFEKCIQELPGDYRLAYILKDVEKLSEDHVCEILGVTKPAMKNRVHAARLVIRKRIEEHVFKRNTSKAAAGGPTSAGAVGWGLMS
ncbi:MAG: sigma-70 family RNA polymerase sigma factor [Acidobacteria bacterium]|nr:sigma-70 family RNA polymerase sigma factor [Acidobacteriota bacterium]